MVENLLPIGSVVLLKGGVKKVMIIGIKPIKKDEPDIVYDYVGVVFPEGFLGNEYNFVFNHDDINDVIFFGYDNPERKAFISAIQEVMNDNDD